MPKWIYDFKNAIHIKDGEAKLVGEEPFIFTGTPALQTKSLVKKVSKSIANQVKLIAIDDRYNIPWTCIFITEFVKLGNCLAAAQVIYCDETRLHIIHFGWFKNQVLLHYCY